ncbi:MAG: hypothetical protein IPH57_11215 [Saprospiraceae bacterium]|nr:hypothetical protein [Saprospiraceae bacterium]
MREQIWLSTINRWRLILIKKINVIMLRSLFIFIFGMMLLVKLSSQNYIPYYNLRNEALFHFQKKEYKIADSLLTESRFLAPPFGKDIHLAAIIKAELGDTSSCLDLIYTSLGVPEFSLASIILRDSIHFLKVISRDSFYHFIKKLKIVDEINIKGYNEEYISK